MCGEGQPQVSLTLSEGGRVSSSLARLPNMSELNKLEVKKRTIMSFSEVGVIEFTLPETLVSFFSFALWEN